MPKHKKKTKKHTGVNPDNILIIQTWRGQHFPYLGKRIVDNYSYWDINKTGEMIITKIERKFLIVRSNIRAAMIENMITGKNEIPEYRELKFPEQREECNKEFGDNLEYIKFRAAFDTDFENCEKLGI